MYTSNVWKYICVFVCEVYLFGSYQDNLSNMSLALTIKYSSSPDASGNVIYSCIYIQIISEAHIFNVWLDIFSDELTIGLRGSNPL